MVVYSDGNHNSYGDAGISSQMALVARFSTSTVLAAL